MKILHLIRSNDDPLALRMIDDIGGGIGVHHADEELDVDTIFGYAREDSSETGFGYHALAGVDFVFASHFSLGVEGFYAETDFDTPISDLDLRGFSIAATFKVHF